MQKWCYINGQIVKSAKPQIKLTDLGLLRGYAVFDFIKVIKGEPLFWPEHLTRFRRSAKLLGLTVKASDADLTKVAKQLLVKNNLNKKDASLRLIMTGGESVNGMTVGGKNTLAILVEESYNLPEKVFKTGGKLITVDYARYFPQAKTTSYLLAVQLQPQKIKASAVEILYVKEDKILEASTSNFFIVKNKTLITAKAGVLPGITREAVIKLAKKSGYKVEERELKFNELKTADEAFITATNKDVCPIVKIDNLKIGNGKVGEVTKELLTKYRELIS